MQLTPRELLTAAAYADAERWPTQAQLASRFGVSRTAITMRLTRALRKLTPAQADELRRRTRIGYRKALMGDKPGRRSVKLVECRIKC